MPAEYTQDRVPWVSRLVSRLAFVFFTFNTATAAYRSINDLPALSFLFIVCVIIVGMFWCLRKFERSDQKNKERLKVAVWILATLLATMFSYRVEEIIPWPVALVIWCLAFAGLRSGYPQLQRLLSLGSNMEPNEDPLSLQDDLESQLASATPAAAMEIESARRRQAPRTPRCAICVDNSTSTFETNV